MSSAAAANRRSPYGGTYNAQTLQHAEATAGTVSSQTQQLNTHAMANLLKDAHDNDITANIVNQRRQQHHQHQAAEYRVAAASDGATYAAELPDRLHSGVSLQGTAVLNSGGGGGLSNNHRYQQQQYQQPAQMR